MSGAIALAPLRDDVRAAINQQVGEALSVALPLVVKLLDNHIDHRLAGGASLFFGGHRP